MDENSPRQKIAALYRVTADGEITLQDGGYAVSNGLAWSPDGRIMYHSDSTAGIIEAWDFDASTGARSNRRIVATLSNDDGRPDGAATDTDGNYWSAGPSAGCINCFSPDGKLLRKWAFPVPGPDHALFRGRPVLRHVAAGGEIGVGSGGISHAWRVVRCGGARQGRSGGFIRCLEGTCFAVAVRTWVLGPRRG